MGTDISLKKFYIKSKNKLVEEYTMDKESALVYSFFPSIKRNLKRNRKNDIRYKNPADKEVLFPTHLQLFRYNVNIWEH